eukprot:SAG22_NODE_67_length_22882_cov_25.671553_2_plen_1223_part_00
MAEPAAAAAAPTRDDEAPLMASMGRESVHVESEFDRNKLTEINWQREVSFEKATIAAEHGQARWNTNPDFHFPHLLSVDPGEFEELYHSADADKVPRPYPIWSTTIDEMGAIGGVGLQLYFGILQGFCMMFGLLGLLSLPSLLVNVLSGLEADGPPVDPLVMLTIGTANSTLPLLSLDGEQCLWLRTLTDALVSVVTIFVIRRLHDMKTAMLEQHDATTVEVGDYSVRLQPKKQFAWTIRRDQEQQFKADVLAALEERGMPVHRVTVEQAGEGPATVEKAAIVLATDSSEELGLKQEKMALLLELEIALRKLKLEPDAHKREKLVQRMLRPSGGLLTKLSAVTEQIKTLSESETISFPVVYVTFEYATAYEMATNDPKITFAKPLQLPTSFGQPVTCKIRHAPEPEAIKWENIHVPKWEQLLRRALVWGSACFVLFCGMVLAVMISEQNNKVAQLNQICGFEPGGGGAAPMTCDIPPGLTDPHPMHGACEHHHGGGHDDEEEGGDDDDFRTTLSMKSVLNTAATYSSVLVDANMTASSQCHLTPAFGAPGVTVSESALCTDNCTGTSDKCDLCFICFCQLCFMADQLRQDTPVGTYCTAYEQFHLERSATQYGAQMMVVVVNVLVKQFMHRVNPVSKYQDVGIERTGLATKIYVVQMLNTAVMTVLIHVPIPIWNKMPFGLAPSEDDWPIDGEWYKTVGAPLQLTVMVNFAATPLVSVLKFLVRRALLRLRRCVNRGQTLGAVTQNQLNKLVEYPEWDMSSSYAVVLVNVSMCLLYSAGMPALLWVGCIGCGMAYWHDKLQVLYFSAKPPLLGAKTFDGIMDVVLLIMVAHNVVGFIMFSNAGGGADADAAPPDPFTGEVSWMGFVLATMRARPHTMCSAAMLILVVAYYVVLRFEEAIIGLAGPCAHCVALRTVKRQQKVMQTNFDCIARYAQKMKDRGTPWPEHVQRYLGLLPSALPHGKLAWPDLTTVDVQALPGATADLRLAFLRYARAKEKVDRHNANFGTRDGSQVSERDSFTTAAVTNELANTDDDYINDELEQLDAAVHDFEVEIDKDAALGAEEEGYASLESLSDGVLNPGRLKAAVAGGVFAVGLPSQWGANGTMLEGGPPPGAPPGARGLLGRARAKLGGSAAGGRQSVDAGSRTGSGGGSPREEYKARRAEHFRKQLGGAGRAKIGIAGGESDGTELNPISPQPAAAEGEPAPELPARDSVEATAAAVDP